MGLLPVLLAPGIFGAEMEDVGQPVPLHPQEEELVAQAAPKRRRDFALGRACARAALSDLGQPDAVIGQGENGAPLWPAGVVGSITHTKGYAAALVAKVQQARRLADAADVDIWVQVDGGVDLDRGDNKSAWDKSAPEHVSGKWSGEEEGVRAEVDLPGKPPVHYVLQLPAGGHTCLLAATPATTTDLRALWFGALHAPDGEDEEDP